MSSFGGVGGGAAPASALTTYFDRLTTLKQINMAAGTPFTYGAFETLFSFPVSGMSAGSYLIQSVVASYVFATDATENNPTLNVALFIDGVQQTDGSVSAIIAARSVTLATLLNGNGITLQVKNSLTAGAHTFELKWRLLGSAPHLGAACDPTAGDNQATISIIKVA